MTRQSERDVRISKITTIRSLGIIPFAQSWDKSHSIQEVREQGQEMRDIDAIMADPQLTYSLAGRVMLKRVSGKLAFGQIMDHGEQIQLMWEHEQSNLIVGESFDAHAAAQLQGASSKRFDYRFVDKMIDVGDWIGVRGELFETHKGELTLFVREYQLLTKAIRPLGDKFHGIGEDQESAYRQRYLDMIFNRESFERMRLRSDFIRTLREFYRERHFVELDTPILGNAASGAAARPFVTHHTDFDQEMYLRIAPEIALKMATVGGMERVFEIGKDFRNEGSSPSHHQEFLVVEHYAAYWTYEDNMRFTEEMFDYLFDHLPQLNKKVMIADKQGVEREVDFSTPRPRIDYVAQIHKDSGIDVSQYGPEDEDELRAQIRAHGHDRVGLDDQATATMIDYLYKKVTRPQIVGPAFIYNYPKTMQPLARTSDADSMIVEQFQAIVNGREILKAYSELVDPVELQANFDAQGAALERGDEEATSGDDDFVLSMEYGMPPQSGWGMGIDRILAMLTEQKNIRDVIMFPMMKPLHQHSTQGVDQGQQEVVVDDATTEYVYQDFPSRDTVDAIAQKYLTDTYGHGSQVARVMEYFARELGQSQDVRYAAGLLHDIDRDVIGKDPEQHLGEQFEQMMTELRSGYADQERDQFIQDIRSHYTHRNVPADSLLRKYLLSVDELSGLIHAYSLMRPEGLDGMKRKSLNKKIKDKKFAAGVDREHVRNCEQYLGVDLSDFAMQVVEAMRG